MGEKDTPDTLFQEAMKRLKGGFGLGIHRGDWKGAGVARTEFQSCMLKAQRIVLDRSFIRAAVAASTLPPDVFLRRLSMIRPPAQTVWIEWDEATRVNALREAGFYKRDEVMQEQAGTIAARAGALILSDQRMPISSPEGERRGEVTGCFCMHSVVLGPVIEDHRDVVDFSGLSIAWKDAPLFPPRDAQSTAHYVLTAALGPGYASRTGVPLDAEHPLAPFLAGGIAGPFSTMTAQAMRRLPSPKKKDLLHAMAQAVVGDWRFIASVLMLWHVRGPMLENATGRIIGAGAGVTGDEVKIARLVLPAPARGDNERKGEGSGRTPPRQHDFTGHWCYSRKNPGKKWWRRGGTRGDPARGKIIKVRKVEAPPPS